MRTKITVLAALIAALLGGNAAFADNDGVNRTTLPGNPAVPGVFVDVGAGAIDLGELSSGVQAELSDLRTDTDANGATIGVQGVAIADHETRVSALEVDSAAHASAITALQSGHAAQQATLDDHEARITAGETKDVEQDARHDTAEAKNSQQDGRLDGHDTQLASHSATLTTHAAQIGSLETVAAAHEVRLDAHDALLSQHSATLGAHGKRLDEHARGLAIAVAMPDAWLSDKKSFGIFGSVGGFEDETALGFAAIGRVSDTWSVNGKLGFDTSGKSFGWQIGAGAQW